MIKQLILLVQVLGLFFYQLIFTGDLTVTQKIPNSMTQGAGATVEITINKDDITGFAKIQQTLPEGFSAELIDTKGATFSFKENIVKFIWMSLPAENEITISYKIIPNANTVGDFTLGGKFSFISESERKNIEIPVANFSVVSAEPIVAETTHEDPIVEEPVTPEVYIICNRSIENTGAGKFEVIVEINKQGIEGFAKITEEIPSGFSATEIDAKGGIFSFKENEAKVLWMAIPKDEKFTISYQIEADAKTENSNYNISGYVSFLKNDITSKYDLDLSSFNYIAEEPVVEETAIEDAIMSDAVVEAPVVESSEIEGPVVEVPVVEEPVAEELTNKNITAVPSPETGVSYKVQVGAGHKTVATNYFAAKFNLKDNVNTINHEGWIKYLVGSFTEYKGARDKRNIVRNKVKRAFVTAYNSGKRITVQEALMISNQKWYK